ncbi:uncharacterized protein LOC133178624 [Saccostrea echinata]|uniref:uncharacterized protein LOC133178624 n=1 Tax=Saccostrea echinata TaxID=191078 RepID=UPI002A7EB279|nr:uncharacterized protein LOC133178624 [Saccostrea echinata]
MVIAFDAKGKGSVQILKQGNNVLFGDVDLNIGGGYNVNKGVFMAPKSGVYVFEWTTLTSVGKYANTSLVVNGKRKAYIHCYDKGRGFHMSCSKMAVVRMTAGDKTCIDIWSGTAWVEPKFSSFSGFMLMHSLLFVVGVSSIFVITNTDKVSPRPSLKSFRDDYDSVAKTCVAVGYVKDHCKNNRDRKNMVIAFDAKAKGSVQSVSKGNIVMFGNVDLNKGGGYNAVKGIFTAPKLGVYVFDWTTMTYTNKGAYTSLVLHGKRRAYNHCHNNGHGIHMSCSKMAVVRMEAGDKAWIDSFHGTSSVYNLYSSFSGYML